MSERGQNIIVGFFVLLGLAVLTLLIVKFQSGVGYFTGRGDYYIEIQAEQTAAVLPGQTIHLNGIAIGRNDRGAAIVEESAALGPPLERRQLRETHPRELRAIHADGALRLAWTPVRAGDRLPFQAVLTDVPPAVGRFELHAIPIEESAPVPEDLL